MRALQEGTAAVSERTVRQPRRSARQCLAARHATEESQLAEVCAQVVRRIQIERPKPKDVHLTDFPAMSLVCVTLSSMHYYAPRAPLPNCCEWGARRAPRLAI